MPSNASSNSPTLPTSLDSDALQAALECLGYERFRPGQREALTTLIERGRLLLVAPTGGGKSLTYQLPPLLLGGTSLVISPLISLMQDQVSALRERGVAATFLASTLDEEEMSERLRGLSAGRYKLVYAAPERLAFPGFRALLRKLDCPLIAIDEAHCISEWGHDFRPDYLQIGDLLKDFPDAHVLACTATATPVVRDEILERLGLAVDTPQLVRGFARPNLALRVAEVTGTKERAQWVDAALAEALGSADAAHGAAIVYSPTRRASERERDRLEGRGWRVAAYHAGLEGAMREAVHRAFSERSLDIVVATNAFGMGIDRADVRAVVHLAPPGSIEAYYQEIGRAGRDGEDALGLMLLSPGDMPRRRHLIEMDAADAASDPEVMQHKWELFLELMRYAEGGSCRHDSILRYFGDEAETLAGCGHCDVCLALAGDEAGTSEQAENEVTPIVRKALSAVARVHGRFGLGAAVALAHGDDDPRLARGGLRYTRTFGVLAERSSDWITRLLRRCVSAGWVDFEGGERPVVVLSQAGLEVMRGERPARLLLPPARRTRTKSAAPRRTGTSSGGAHRAQGTAAEPNEQALDDADQRLFEALRSHRLEVARAESVPPYVVASDRSLREMARLRPRSPGELLQVHGIGPSKLERYGEGLLAVVAEAG